MEDEILQIICESVNNKYLLDLQHREEDEPFHFAPYVLYTFRGNYGLFGTERVYHSSGNLEVDSRDLVIENYFEINGTELHFDKSFFIENFRLIGHDELVIECANEDYPSNEEE